MFLPRFAVPVLTLGTLITVARAALWETSDWALGSSIEGSVGYDSNLTLSNDGPEDGYIKATPALMLNRRNSSTDFHVRGSVSQTEFVNNRLSSETDFYLGAVYAYPNVQNVIPLYRADLSWVQTAEPNQYLGRRVKHDLFNFAGEGYVSISSKLGLRGQAAFYTDDYKDQTLNSNRRAQVFAGLVYEKRPGFEYSLNLGYGNGKSAPKRTDMFGAAVTSDEAYITAQVRGEITPKVTGKLYAGFGQVKYSGGYENRYNLPVAGADVTWSIDPRRTVVLAAYSGVEYAPDGQSVDTTRAFVSFTNVIVGSWQYLLRGGPTRSVFRREVRQGTDTAWEGGAELAYRPSERFNVSLAVTAGQHRSDIEVRDYNRTAISLTTYYRF